MKDSREMKDTRRGLRTPGALIALMLASAAAACSGEIGNTPPGDQAGSGGSSPSATGGGGSAQAGSSTPGSGGSGGGASGGGGSANTTPAVKPASVLAPTSRTARLSRSQWENTVRDLLNLPTAQGLADKLKLAGDAVLYFDNEGDALYVDDTSRGPLELAAETLATQVTADAAAAGAAKLVPANAPTALADKAKAFITSFGQRAYRRPLLDSEVAEATALFNKAATLYPGVDPFLGGARLVLQLMLQSPNFLYRSELSTKVVDNKIPLSSYEVASKISYAIANTTPDDQLMAAAAQDALKTADQVSAQAKRLMSSPAGIANLKSFHFQVLKLGGYDGMNKDVKTFPEFKVGVTPGLLRDETNMFVEYVFNQNLGFKGLLTTPVGFVNATTAPLYGLSAASFGADLKKVDLDPAQRSGLLTLPGFLASNAHQVEIDSIHRGVFVLQRLLCVQIAPPAGALITPVPDADGTAKTTNRQRVEQHTGKGTCGAGCHATLINPAGFAFEKYDAVGKFRTTDNGLPINAADSFTFESEDAPKNYDGALEFSKVLADSREANVCYAADWMSYLFSRQVVNFGADEPDHNPMVDYLADQSLHNGMSIKDLLMTIASTDYFLARLPGGQ